APAGQACLAGISLRQAGRRLPLDSSGPLVIGRAATADLVLEGEATVSSQHARIIPMPPYYAVEDLDSTNGPLVNGQRIMERRMVGLGDVLQFGDVQFRLEATPPAAVPGPPPPGIPVWTPPPPPPGPYASPGPPPYAGYGPAPAPPAYQPAYSPYPPAYPPH